MRAKRKTLYAVAHVALQTLCVMRCGRVDSDVTPERDADAVDDTLLEPYVVAIHDASIDDSPRMELIPQDSGAADAARPVDIDASIRVSDAYFPYWTKALFEGGSAMIPNPPCNICLFSFVSYPVDNCSVGTACVFKHCQSSADGASLWECVESCFPIGSDCVTAWNDYMALAVKECADACR
jgi:hypothetical protein